MATKKQARARGKAAGARAAAKVPKANGIRRLYAYRPGEAQPSMAKGVYGKKKELAKLNDRANVINRKSQSPAPPPNTVTYSRGQLRIPSLTRAYRKDSRNSGLIKLMKSLGKGKGATKAAVNTAYNNIRFGADPFSN